MSHAEITDESTTRTVHRLAVVLVCLVWPLIWIGGLVTTYDAGMAVPDWPNTYGSNLFLYPVSTWVFGPFDLFIEHGHRLLASLVGLISIVMLVAAIRSEPRGWVKGLTALVLAMVIAQGVLGGIRVLLGDRTTAMIHGCVGPLCFAMCVVTMVVTSRSWWHRKDPADADPTNISKKTRGYARIALTLLVLSYLQLVLGAQLRHAQPSGSPRHFTGIVGIHVMNAFLLWFLCFWAWLKLRRCGDLTLSRSGLLLIGLVALQIGLGIGTWVVKYGWPSMLQFVPGSAEFVVRAKGFSDALIVTAHVAIGSLILAVATYLLTRVLRFGHTAVKAEGIPA